MTDKPARRPYAAPAIDAVLVVGATERISGIPEGLPAGTATVDITAPAEPRIPDPAALREYLAPQEPPAILMPDRRYPDGRENRRLRRQRERRERKQRKNG